MDRSIAEKIIKTTKHKRSVLFWSGGYDSTFLYKTFLDYKLYEYTDLCVVIIICPQTIYDKKKINKELLLLSKLPLRIYCTEPLEKIDGNIDFSSACSVCKKIRRNAVVKILKEIANDDRETILITGHNLDDLAAYYTEHQILSLDSSNKNFRSRFVECANKIIPLFDYCDKLKIFRPLIEYSKKDLLNYFSIEEYDSISICSKKCPWLNQRKRLIQKYIQNSDINLNFSLLEKKFYESFDMPTMEEYRSLNPEIYLM